MIFKPHTTVATIVARDNRYLMVEEIIRDRPMLNQPAGHLDAGETLIDAAIRETLEETGCHVRVTALVGIYQWTAPDNGRQFLRFTFAAEYLEQAVDAVLDKGIVRAPWLDRPEIEAGGLPLRSPVILESLSHYESGIRYPLSVLHWQTP